jgi:uncharacterized protein YutD
MQPFNFTVVENKHNGVDAIKLLDEPFSGIIISYGEVAFEEDDANDTLRLKFEYHIHDKANKQFTDMKPFEKYLGDLLQHLIHEGIRDNSLTYTGGIDENRTGDPFQPDSQ